MNQPPLSERDICTKFITPALRNAGWDEMAQIREEVGFTKGRNIVRGKLVTRGRAKRADYVLRYKPNVPIAVIEAKDDRHSVCRWPIGSPRTWCASTPIRRRCGKRGWPTPTPGRPAPGGA